MKKIKEIITRSLAPLTRTFALLLATCAITSAWADTTLKTTVSGGSFTVNNVNAAAFDNCTQTVAASPTLTIPASTDLPAGTKVAITTISLGKRADNNYPASTVVPDKIRIVVGTQTYTSAAVAEDSSDYFISEANNNNTARKMKYSFDGTGCILEVGESYDIKLLNSSGTEISGTNVLNVRVVKNSESLFGDTIYADVGGNRWTPVQEIAGDIIYTCTVASDGSSTWDITPPSSSTLRYWFEVAESTSFNIGTISCKSAYFNVGDEQTLTLSGSVSASSDIYVMGGTVSSPLGGLSGTLKGDGTLCYDMNNGTTKPSGLTCTDSSWKGTLWLKNGAYTGWNFNNYGSTASTVKISNITCYLNDSETLNPVLELEGDGLKITNGNGYKVETVKKLKGTGALSISGGSSNGNGFVIKDASEFAGSITTPSNRYLVTIGESGSYGTSGKIVINSGYSATVASGKTWTAGGGFQVNGTLTLEASTSTLSGTVTGLGVVECTESIPSITGLSASGWTGTVKIAADASSGTSWTSGDLMNSGSTLEVTAGMLKVADVSKLTGSVKIDNGAYLWVTDTASTSADLKISDFSGILYLDRNSALESMQVDMGTLRNLTAGHVFYSGKTVDVGVTLKEIHGEGGTITLSAPDLTNHATSYSIVREDGATVSATFSNGVLTYAPAISGAATMYDVSFLNTTEFVYKRTASANIGLDTAQDPKYNNSLNDATTGIYLRHHPYVNGAKTDIHGLTDFTLVVVGQMSPTHKTQFIHIGSTTSSNKGLLIATTDKDDEVIIVPNTGKVVDESNYVKVTVPNAASARHAYVINKTGSVFTVWVDGIKRGNFTVAAGWEIGSSDHAGVQVGSDFGGEIQRDTSNPDRYKSVADSLDETGVVNVIRIFDYVITDAQAQAIVAAYPYVSEGGLYTRTISAAADLSETDAWAKNGSATTYALPEGATVDEVSYNPSVTVTVDADATLTVNANLTVDTLTVESTGGNTLSVESDGTHAIGVSGAAVVNSPLSITYGALSLAGTPVQLGSGGTLAFDCSGIDISEVYTTTSYQLTGLMDQDDAKVTVVVPTAPARTATKNYNANGYYELVVTADHAAGSEVYFGSGYLDGTMTGSGGTGTVYLETDHTHQTVLFPGDTMVIDNNSSLYQDQVWVSDAFIGNIKVTRTTQMTLHNGELTNPILVGKTIAVESGALLTIAKHTSYALTFGALTINGAGGVTLSGAMTLNGAVSGTATVTADGAISVGSDGSIANTISGSGTITYAALPSTTPAGFTSWTGTVQLPSFNASSDGINFNNYGIGGSTVELTGGGMTSGWLKGDGVNVLPKLQLTGPMTVNAMNLNGVYSFAEITGSGNLTFGSENQPSSLTITKVAEGYLGTISSTLTTPVIITTLDRPAGTSTASGTKLLSKSGDVTVSGVTYGGVSQSITPYYATDGVYVDYGVVSEGEGSSAVTTVETPATTTSASITLPDSYAGTVVVPPNVGSLTTTGTSLATDKVVVKYGTTDISGAFTIGGAAGNITITLDKGGRVGGVSVDPEPAETTPMVVNDDAVPTFTVKAIPGLWYRVVTGTSISGGNLGGTPGAGNAIQADGTTVSPVAPEFSGNIQYYKIAVGTTQAME